MNKTQNKKIIFDQNLAERKVIRILINKSIKSSEELEKEVSSIQKEWFKNETFKRFLLYAKEQLKRKSPVDVDHFLNYMENGNQNSILEFQAVQQTKISASEDLYKRQLQQNYLKEENSKSILELYSRLKNGEDIDITAEILALYQKNFANTVGEELPKLEENFMSILDQEFIDEKLGLGRVKTHIENFDKEYSGFKRGDLIIIGARPSMGKTSLLITMAIGAMMSNLTYPTAIFSGEVSPIDMRKKMISVYSFILNNNLFIPLETMMQFINYEEYKDLIETVNNEFFKKFEKSLIIIDTIGKDANFVRENLLTIKKERGGVNIGFLDYLQILKLPGKNKRHEEIADVSREFKAIARELNFPFVVLAQLNRELERRDDKRPIPSDLKDSGSIEQDADLIAFIYRDEVYSQQKTSNADVHDMSKMQDNPISQTELIIGKNRNGKTGTVYLMFHKATTGFFSKANINKFDFKSPKKGYEIEYETIKKEHNIEEDEIKEKLTIEDVISPTKMINKSMLKQIE